MHFHVFLFFITCDIEAMFASTSRNLGHLVHHYGGTAVGSFIEPDQSPLKGSVTRAMFVDATHDNDPGHIQVGKPLCLFICWNNIFL